ncbi:DUF5993 family protein [Shewanella pneumatophori]|uniref:DUF5993 family protein n=1 Tax=Shewanella pneumatophori TaxID=314092 RepID=A0A9X1ZG08_9GAMM|nr:DUF5993 family protein [Shewanella pneumatophori]MCL1139170.1 DUF5993 family protein [Shewanella pneumatophori]
MMTLLFVLFLMAMIFALKNKRTLAFYSFAIALVASIFWFSHHASDTLAILL